MSNETKFCVNCGAEIDAKAEVCPKCGVRQPNLIKNSGNGLTRRVIAALFAFFLGGFGIHKFYLGKTGQGILYILFSWTGIPGIIAFIEGIMYLLMSDGEFENKYM